MVFPPAKSTAQQILGEGIKQDFDINRRNFLMALSAGGLGSILPTSLWPTFSEVAGSEFQCCKSAVVDGALEYRIRVAQIPHAVSQLARKGRNFDWLVFMFRTPEISSATDDQIPNLQFSKTSGIVGLEWVLLGERNLADRPTIVSLAESRHNTVQLQTINEVPLLRIEGHDIIGLAQAIVSNLYGLSANSEIGLLVSGIEI